MKKVIGYLSDDGVMYPSLDAVANRGGTRVAWYQAYKPVPPEECLIDSDILLKFFAAGARADDIIKLRNEGLI